MSGDNRSYIDQILDAIDYGKLTVEETERRLQIIIDEEERQIERPANAELLRLCYSLLFQLHTHGAISIESHKAQNMAVARERYNTMLRSKRKSKTLCYIALAAMLILVFSTGATLRIRWFTQTSTQDEQQHQIIGHEVRVDLIRKALAANSELTMFETQSPTELYEQLGFDPVIPVTINGVWTVDNYAVFYRPDSLQIVTNYIDKLNDENGLAYIQFCFTDIGAAYLSFEQNMEGIFIEVNGKSVYFSMNENRSLFTWIDHETVYCLAGDISKNDGVQIITDIGRMENEENRQL